MKLLDILNEKKGEYISGEEIAKRLQVSRNAIWKAVNALRDEGICVEAIPNKGYRVLSDSDILSVSNILRHTRQDFRVEILKSVDSTNTYLKQQAEKGEAALKVVVAMQQTHGKGRMGRSFFAPMNGVYMSILLRPMSDASCALAITSLAGVAVCQAIENLFGLNPQVKWVNDVYIGDKKVCGILSEAALNMETGFLDYVVLGIGVNLYSPKGGYPKELEGVVTGLLDSSQSDGRSRLIAEILNCFFSYYEKDTQSQFVTEYKKRSNVIGKKIFVISGEEKTPALAVDIDDCCRLIVETANGIRTISSGEVSIRWQEHQ